ncbi:hypothetical protein AAE478_008216 [Parahypoxylon ruwenzoriense]
MGVETKNLSEIVDGEEPMSPLPPVVSSIPKVKVTVESKPFLQPDDDQRLLRTGTARVNILATYEKPYGTAGDEWAERRQDKTVLQQHCEFFDFLATYPAQDHDGITWSQDTDKHGSDTGVFDAEGRFAPQRYENVFAKYACCRDYLIVWKRAGAAQGPAIRKLTCDESPGLATYLVLRPADGRMMNENIRGIYNGSIFYTIAKRRVARK